MERAAFARPFHTLPVTAFAEPRSQAHEGLAGFSVGSGSLKFLDGAPSP